MKKQPQDKKKTEPKRSENPDPVDIHVGGRVRLRRNLIGISQEQLARALNLTFQQVQKYERGANRMAASRLYQIAQALSVPITYFFDGLTLPETMLASGFAEAKQAPLSGAPEPMTGGDVAQGSDTLKFVRAYHRITDPVQRRRIYELMRSMAETDVDAD